LLEVQSEVWRLHVLLSLQYLFQTNCSLKALILALMPQNRPESTVDKSPFVVRKFNHSNSNLASVHMLSQREIRYFGLQILRANYAARRTKRIAEYWFLWFNTQQIYLYETVILVT
jgi:hypothetical protein